MLLQHTALCVITTKNKVKNPTDLNRSSNPLSLCAERLLNLTTIEWDTDNVWDAENT